MTQPQPPAGQSHPRAGLLHPCTAQLHPRAEPLRHPRAEPVEARLSGAVRPSTSLGRRACAIALAGALLAFAAPPVVALEEGAGEKKAIDACDKRLCTIVQRKDPTGEDLKCALTKTWARSTLKEGDQRDVKWTFGDARCSVQLNLSRAKIVEALTGDRVKLWVPAHTANCIVEEDGKVQNVTATVAPKITFEHGKAKKIWINLLKVQGPAAIKATLHAGAHLNDTWGIIHRPLLKSVNGYINKHCPKYHPLTHAVASPPAKPKPPAAKAGEPAQPAAPKKEGG
ncbi:MAG: hypothetical protein AB7O44_01875 [Hyphomicrobiaceae bacterium]